VVTPRGVWRLNFSNAARKVVIMGSLLIRWSLGCSLRDVPLPREPSDEGLFQISSRSGPRRRPITSKTDFGREGLCSPEE